MKECLDGWMVVGQVTGWTGNSWPDARMAASRFFSPQPTLPQFHSQKSRRPTPLGRSPRPQGRSVPGELPGSPAAPKAWGRAVALGRGVRAGVAPHSTPHPAEGRVRALLSRIDVGGGGGRALGSRGMTRHIQRSC